jgi:hypothetical protein
MTTDVPAGTRTRIVPPTCVDWSWQPMHSARFARTLEVSQGWPDPPAGGGCPWTWQLVQANGPVPVQVTVGAGCPGGAWQLTLHVVPDASLVMVPLTAWPLGRVKPGARPRTPPQGWHIRQALAKVECTSWAPVPTHVVVCARAGAGLASWNPTPAARTNVADRRPETHPREIWLMHASLGLRPITSTDRHATRTAEPGKKSQRKD